MPDLSDWKKGGGPASVAGSTPFSEGGRKPALVIGGWDPDQDAKVTKTGAEDVLKSVAAPMELSNLFVHGVRRGYAILPVDERAYSNTPKP